jgi:hypothetical protein
MSDKLTELYSQIDKLSDEIPAQLSKKIKLYSYSLLVIGRYHRASINAHGQSYANRKKVWGETILNAEGTAKDKEAAAEVTCYPYRQKEAEAEAERQYWKDSLHSTTEIINALKAELRNMTNELNQAG